eukprot:230757_1
MSIRWSWKKTGITVAAGSLLLICSNYVANKLYKKVNCLPPGPTGIPFIGYTLHTLFIYKWYINVARKYGPIVSLKTLNKNIILINSSKIAKQILSRKDLQDRDTKSHEKMFNMMSKTNDLPFGLVNGIEWKQRRKIVHAHLIRILTTEFVNDVYRQSINEKLIPYLNNIINSKNKLWYPREIATYLAFNTIFQANFGKLSDSEQNSKHRQLMDDLGKIFLPQTFLRIILTRLLPFLKYSPLFMRYLNDLRNRLIENVELLMQNATKNSFIDYNKQLVETKQISKGRQIADVLLTFAAGTDTTALTLEHGIICLAKQPVIQQRVRNELKKNIPSAGIDVVYDIHVLLKLPLFRALIHEILRISSLTQLGVAHYLNNDIFYRMDNGKQYKLAKGNLVMYNVDYIHCYSKNEKWRYDLFTNGNAICLENWLKITVKENTKNIQFYMNESFMAFGYGARDCVGKQLAKKELRIVFAFLLLNYQFSLKDPNQKIKTKGNGLGSNSIEPQIPVII